MCDHAWYSAVPFFLCMFWRWGLKQSVCISCICHTSFFFKKKKKKVPSSKMSINSPLQEQCCGDIGGRGTDHLKHHNVEDVTSRWVEAGDRNAVLWPHICCDNSLAQEGARGGAWPSCTHHAATTSRHDLPCSDCLFQRTVHCLNATSSKWWSEFTTWAMMWYYCWFCHPLFQG